MFSNIIVYKYLPWIIGLIIIYYLYVGLRYYRTELKELFKPKKRIDDNPFLFNQQDTSIDDKSSQEVDYHEVSFEQTSDDTFDRIEELIKRLKPAISEAAVKSFTSDQLANTLKVILYNFPDLKKSPFRPAISELIHTECKDNGSTVLSEQEIEELWEA